MEPGHAVILRLEAAPKFLKVTLEFFLPARRHSFRAQESNLKIKHGFALLG